MSAAHRMVRTHLEDASSRRMPGTSELIGARRRGPERSERPLLGVRVERPVRPDHHGPPAMPASRRRSPRQIQGPGI